MRGSSVRIVSVDEERERRAASAFGAVGETPAVPAAPRHGTLHDVRAWLVAVRSDARRRGIAVRPPGRSATPRRRAARSSPRDLARPRAAGLELEAHMDARVGDGRHVGRPCAIPLGAAVQPARDPRRDRRDHARSPATRSRPHPPTWRGSVDGEAADGAHLPASVDAELLAAGSIDRLGGPRSVLRSLADVGAWPGQSHAAATARPSRSTCGTASRTPTRPCGHALPLGKYTLVRRLATGRHGRALSRDPASVAGFEKLVVIKRILPLAEPATARSSRCSSTRRASPRRSRTRTSSRSSTSARSTGTYFIAMEHVHGEDLRSIVRADAKGQEHRVPARARALHRARHVLRASPTRTRSATSTARPLNIVHRDISPQNVVVTFTGDVKVVDFGIAKSDTRAAARTRAAGQLKGKIPYMSPEQARGEPIDWRDRHLRRRRDALRADDGQAPLQGRERVRDAQAHLRPEYPLAVASRAPAIRRELEAIVMRALAKDRDDRWQSAREMQGDLEEFVRRERLGVSTIALSQFMQRLLRGEARDPERSAPAGQAARRHHRAAEPGTSAGLDVEPGYAGRDHERGGDALGIAVAGPTTVQRIAHGRAGSGRGVERGGRWPLVGRAPGSNQASQLVTEEPGAGHGTLAIASDPPGATISINGVPRPEKTPAKVGNLPVGQPYQVTVARTASGSRPERDPDDREPSGAMSVVLRRATLTVDVGVSPPTPGATLTLDGKPCSRPSSTTSPRARVISSWSKRRATRRSRSRSSEWPTSASTSTSPCRAPTDRSPRTTRRPEPRNRVRPPGRRRPQPRPRGRESST